MLNPQMMTDNGDEIIFHIEGLTKTKRPSKPHVSVSLVKYEEDVIDCLRQYLSRTEDIRKDDKQKTTLFLGVIKPFKPVKPCSIARWFKRIMTKEGIDTDIY